MAVAREGIYFERDSVWKWCKLIKLFYSQFGLFLNTPRTLIWHTLPRGQNISLSCVILSRCVCNLSRDHIYIYSFIYLFINFKFKYRKTFKCFKCLTIIQRHVFRYFISYKILHFMLREVLNMKTINNITDCLINQHVWLLLTMWLHIHIKK